MGYAITLPSGLVRVPSLRGILTAIRVENPLVAITGAGTTTLVPNTTKPFLFCDQRITVAAGSYTRNFALSQANAIKGSIYTLTVEIAAGADANLILPFYDHTTGGTNIENLFGDAAAQYYVLIARNTGTNWEKLSGQYNL